MIIEVNEIIKLINGLRDEIVGYNRIVQDDINKMNEKALEEYDKAIKSLTLDKHILIEKNQELENQLSNLEYREKELKEAREQIELFKQQNQSYSNTVYDLENQINSNEEILKKTINEHKDIIKMLIDDKEKLRTDIDFIRNEFNKTERKYLEENAELRTNNFRLSKKVEKLTQNMNKIRLKVSGEEGWLLEEIQEIIEETLDKEVQ